MLLPFYKESLLEAGVDEAGRGCLAGPVFAAAVILPKDFYHPLLNDSKQLSEAERLLLRPVIERTAIAFAVAQACHQTIDSINILQASIQCMHEALKNLQPQPQHLIIDGHYFKPYANIPHQCIVKGDGKYTSIAAASILAKTHRDDYMKALHESYPQYGWAQNKGYPTKPHQRALQQFGPSPHHRMSFRLTYC